MRLRVPLIAAMTGAIVLTGGVAVATTPVGGKRTAEAAPTQPVKWGQCPADADVWHDTFCGTITVPLDYAKPTGRQITLMLSRVTAGGEPGQRKGVLLVNPGGPGESGLGVAHEVWAKLSTADQRLADGYDVIGFDPRGVGHSTPVSCGDLKPLFPRPLPDYVATTADQQKPHLDRARTIADRCGSAGADLLPHITTTNAARDIDRIRAALGEQKINYLGYSYGSTLGATYATLFPTRVNRMILDSVVDPDATNYQAGFDQSRAMQVRMNQLFDWTAKHNGTFRLGKTRAAVSTAFSTLRGKLATRPAGGVVGPSELDDMTAGSMYVDAQWSTLASAVSAAVRGDDSGLVDAGKKLSLDAPADAATLSYNCADSPWPRAWSTWDADTRQAHQSAPAGLAWLNTWYSAPCLTWPVQGKRETPISGKGLPPVLLLQSKYDPATPLAGAQRMRTTLPSSRLVVEGGGNHALYLYNENACVDRIGNAYLLTGAVPAKDTQCPATPAPSPGSGALRGSDPADVRAHVSLRDLHELRS